MQKCCYIAKISLWTSLRGYYFTWFHKSVPYILIIYEPKIKIKQVLFILHVIFILKTFKNGDDYLLINIKKQLIKELKTPATTFVNQYMPIVRKNSSNIRQLSAHAEALFLKGLLLHLERKIVKLQTWTDRLIDNTPTTLVRICCTVKRTEWSSFLNKF